MSNFCVRRAPRLLVSRHLLHATAMATRRFTNSRLVRRVRRGVRAMPLGCASSLRRVPCLIRALFCSARLKGLRRSPSPAVEQLQGATLQKRSELG